MKTRLLVCFALLILFAARQAHSADDTPKSRPNIVWLSCEDISPHLGCYGDSHAITPHLDQLASEGVRYANAFTTAGVCAPCRSGIITGMYQSSLGTHHMRCNAKLPEHIRAFPTYLREAGYYCTNNSKTDYQFKPGQNPWDKNGKVDWSGREDGQPFFAVFNFTGCHESGIANPSKYKSVTSKLTDDQRQAPDALELPPYYPDTPVTREDWKRNYELITAMDAWAGELIQKLKDEGLYENTIIVFWSDHGVGLPRAKRWLYDSGTHVPLIVRVPAQYRVDGQGRPGTVDDQLISSIDFGPTVLNLAGLTVPEHMQGRAFLGSDLTDQRDHVYGARDRMDERYDIIRSVRDKRYRYIRNYEPWKTYYQYMNTPEKGETMKEIRRVADEGKATPDVALFLVDEKPAEELYDLENDPHELRNLAGDPKYGDRLQRMRQVHLEWVADSRDLGLIPESLLTKWRGQGGSEWSILQRENAESLVASIRDTAVAASEGAEGLAKCRQSLTNPNAAVRYWACIGLGNNKLEESKDFDSLTRLLEDSETTVRVAAARALARQGRVAPAIPVLTEALQHEDGWQRLRAAIVLDEMNEQARPALPALQAALKNQPNKYIVRVANKAVNDLLGTANTVP